MVGGLVLTKALGKSFLGPSAPVQLRFSIFGAEQLWIAHECGDNPERFVGENHLALARLQIDSNIRFERGLPDKNGRRALMGLGEQETLMDRIALTGSRKPEDVSD